MNVLGFGRKELLRTVITANAKFRQSEMTAQQKRKQMEAPSNLENGYKYHHDIKYLFL